MKESQEELVSFLYFLIHTGQDLVIVIVIVIAAAAHSSKSESNPVATKIK